MDAASKEGFVPSQPFGGALRIISFKIRSLQVFKHIAGGESIKPFGSSAPRTGRERLALVVGRGSSDRFSLPVGFLEGLAERRILAAGEPDYRILATAEPLLHRVRVFPEEQLGPLHAVDRVQVIAINKVFRSLLLAVVEMVPRTRVSRPLPSAKAA